VTKTLLVVIAVLISAFVALAMGIIRKMAGDSLAEAVTVAVVTFFICLTALIPVLNFLIP
jgi:hypothetical protein